MSEGAVGRAPEPAWPRPGAAPALDPHRAARLRLVVGCGVSNAQYAAAGGMADGVCQHADP